MKAYHYFEFTPSDWFTGNIMYLDWESKGMFIELCAHYWNKECEMSYKDAKVRCPNIDKLIDADIIKVEKDFIHIDFLDEHKEKCLNTSKSKSYAGKLGAEKRWQSIAGAKHVLKSAIAENGIIEDNIKEDKIIQDNRENNARELYPLSQVIESFERHDMKHEAENFYNYYMANGWKVGKVEMASLEHAVIKWIKNADKFENKFAKVDSIDELRKKEL